jgi:hypothetical protein
VRGWPSYAPRHRVLFRRLPLRSLDGNNFICLLLIARYHSSTLNREAVRSSETSARLNLITQRYIQEDSNYYFLPDVRVGTSLQGPGTARHWTSFLTNCSAYRYVNSRDTRTQGWALVWTGRACKPPPPFLPHGSGVQLLYPVAGPSGIAYDWKALSVV